MPDYRRAWHAGGIYFFTVNLLQRQQNDLLVRRIDVLRDVVKITRKSHPFRIHGWVVLPDHLHCVIELPPDDVDFALRWRLIKTGFSKALPKVERLSSVRAKRGGQWPGPIQQLDRIPNVHKGGAAGGGVGGASAAGNGCECQ